MNRSVTNTPSTLKLIIYAFGLYREFDYSEELDKSPNESLLLAATHDDIREEGR